MSPTILDYLPYFLAVAEHGSVARAAERLHRAASAVTRALSELEQRLGLVLFERKPRGMLLNRVGEVVRLRALRVQEEVDAATDEFLRLRSEAQKQHLRNALYDILFSSRKLLLLVTLAEQRNLSTAAKRLQLTQAGASMALSRMESVLGQKLFQRMLQGMVPTDHAARLILRAKRILSEMRQIDADTSILGGELSGVVSIGILPLGRTYIVPTAIAAMVKAHPRVRIVAVDHAYEQLVAQLRSGEIDVIFGALRAQDDSQGLVSEALFDDALGVIVRAGHPLTQGLSKDQTLQLKSLLGEQWLLPRPHAPGRRLIDSSFKALGLEPPVPTVETGDLAVMRQILSCSDVLTATSPQQLMFEIQSGSLVKLPVALGSTTRQIGLTTRAGALLSPATAALLLAIRNTVHAFFAHKGASI